MENTDTRYKIFFDNIYSIGDLLKRYNKIYDLFEDILDNKEELDKSEDEMERLINDGWDYIKLVGRKNTIEKAFDVIGIKYVS